MTDFINKLTLKAIGAQPRKNSITAKTMLATMYGRIVGKAVGVSEYGEYIRFKGNFEAVNTDTGESYSSAVLIVPQALESMLDASTEGNNSVDFAVEVWAEPNPDSMTGYAYVIRPLTKPQEADPLEELRGLAKAATEASKTPAKGKAKG